MRVCAFWSWAGGEGLLHIAERCYQYSSILDVGEIRDITQFCARGFHVCDFWSWGEGRGGGGVGGVLRIAERYYQYRSILM